MAFLARIWVMALLALALPSGAGATMVLPSTIDYMTTASAAVVVGTVTGVESFWQDRKILTKVTVAVQENVKTFTHVAPVQVEVVYPGGSVGDVNFEVDGMPVFQTGEKVVLFLTSQGEYYAPFGYYYGICRVTVDPSTGQEMISGPPMYAGVQYDLSTGMAYQARGPIGPRTLNSFLGEVRTMVQQQEGR